jgi:hypothetical protein
MRYLLFGRWGRACPRYKADPSSTWGIYCYCGYDKDFHK